MATGCPKPKPSPPATSGPSAPTSSAAGGSLAAITNDTKIATTVYLAFGSNSVVLPSSPGWSFCAGSGLNCSFPLAAGATQALPLAGQWLNVTVSFGAPVTCNTTKAEININNPAWYDIADVSLVDGFSNFVAVYVTGAADAGTTIRLGPPNGPTGNEQLVGVYPLGCDLCVARGSPPCGMKPGTDGCKAGTQYDPKPPCQYQGATKGGGGSTYTVKLLSGAPL